VFFLSTTLRILVRVSFNSATDILTSIDIFQLIDCLYLSLSRTEIKLR